THSPMPPATGGQPSGGLPQPGGGSRGYSPIGSNPTQGSLPGRAMPVHDDPSDDEVDVPPFMRR
ncbi:cell division protein FtsZ, partial [Amycolatopsis sp. SID8362]|nr:cell division protein FtsZ [Amycolatopsis sp. SID8362]NED41116.1 cell division protein FtsZ [Amycolatopsis sp. SID8362]